MCRQPGFVSPAFAWNMHSIRFNENLLRRFCIKRLAREGFASAAFITLVLFFYSISQKRTRGLFNFQGKNHPELFFILGCVGEIFGVHSK
jgi:hypothetical protein